MNMPGRENNMYKGPAVGCSTVSAKGLKEFHGCWEESRTSGNEVGDRGRARLCRPLFTMLSR